MTVKTDSYIIGNNSDDTRNFLLDTDLAGAMRIRRKSDGSGGLLATFDSSGNLQLGAASGANANRMVLSTAQNTTSGTSIDFTGIPSWVKRITVMFNGVSTSGASNPLMQIGSGAIDTTGYATGTEGYFQASNSSTATTFPANGFLLHQDRSAATASYGVLTLVTLGSNIWAISGMHSNGAVQITNVVGVKTALSGTLDRLRITTVSGTDTFDAGSVNIMYEG
jgi:hypothetical protein